jgi:thioredoxin-disulfide reductase
VSFYKENAPDKTEAEVLETYTKKALPGGGPTHYKLLKGLKKKYDGKAPEVIPSTNRLPKEEVNKKKEEQEAKKNGPGIKTASLEELQEEIKAREEAAAEAAAEAAEAEDAPEEVSLITPFVKGDFPERVAIIGGGPAGLAAAIYASRAGLRPVVIAPPMGGQLQGKGVMVENYPAVSGVTGPAIVGSMMTQAAEFGTTFEQTLVESMDLSKKPFTIKTEGQTIQAHTIILATGADSNWLGVDGEHKYRGGGVSSCATCDGFLYRDQEVVVIGGGDTAMEDALVLARTSSKVTVLHRRDSFRASHVLAQRVLTNDKIQVIWNTTVDSFSGTVVQVPGDDEGTTTDVETLSTVHVKDTTTGETSEIGCAAAFVAIGHSPNTKILGEALSMDKTGYVLLKGDGSTYTSVEGVFAAGDIADSVYRQAVTSSGSGAMAALDAERWLSEQGIGDEAAEFEAAMVAEMLAEMGEREERAPPAAYKEPKKEEPVATEEEKPAPTPAQAADDDEEVEVVEEHTEL